MKTWKYHKSILIIIIISFLFSCNSDYKRDATLLPKISGKTGEILLVISKKKWEGDMGQAFRDILAYDQYGLPQPEPIFDFVNITPGGFSKLHQPHRNIIFVKTGKDFKEPKITFRKNRWAYPQLVINIEGPDDLTVIDLLEQNGDKIVTWINGKERARLTTYYKGLMDPDIAKNIEKDHQVHLVIPVGYSLDVNKKDFAWVANEPHFISQGILIYHYPYTDTNTFTPEYLIRKRNYYLKKYVPGPNPGTYMTTEDLLKPEFKEFEIGKRYFAQLRGLWKLENGFMGGPFISLSTVDEKLNRVVTVEGFVYAPGDEKREFLRQLETILYTLKLQE
ncbi:MAG: DUF4837 family protein [Bacteroidetes bacterium]|nr:DUF4837 family protein [Bacteroidota bacterium]